MKSGSKLRRTILILSGVLIVTLVLVGIIVRTERNMMASFRSSLAANTLTKERNVEKELDLRFSFLEVLSSAVDLKQGNLSDFDKDRLAVACSNMEAKVVGVLFTKTSTMDLSDGRVVSFDDDEVLRSIENERYYISRIDATPYGYSYDDIVTAMPVFVGNEYVGFIFALYAIDSFMDTMDGPIMDDAGFSMVVRRDGDVLIPAWSFAERDSAGKIVLKYGEGNRIEKYINAATDNKELSFMVEDAVSGTLFNGYLRYMDGNFFENLVIVSMVPAKMAYGKGIRIANISIAVLAFVALFIIFEIVFFIIKEKKSASKIDDVMKFDSLTGLPTKPYHKELVEELLTKNKNTDYAYAIIDVSEFKYVNSTFNYDYGNDVLKSIANSFSSSITKDETISRTSGDHFGMLLKYYGKEALGQRLLSMMEKAGAVPPYADGRSINIIMNCGVYVIEDERDVNRIRARANVAKKSLKKYISNQVAFYSDEEFNKEAEAHELAADFSKAIDCEEFVVYLQPKFDISNETVTGAEALIRWNHPTKGFLAPGAFISIAENNGFIKEIDFYMFERVCKMMGEWSAEGRELIVISVNFSRLHLHDDHFVGKLKSIASKYNVPPQYLEIELTESALFDEMGKLLNVMYMIKEAGFSLSMDDFGSGYSSLNLLREMPVDVLKLDKGFLDDCGDDNVREQKVISHVISMAKDLDITVLAEGVENKAQKEFLRGANCDIIQGYYYSKPMPMREFEKYMKKNA